MDSPAGTSAFSEQCEDTTSDAYYIDRSTDGGHLTGRSTGVPDNQITNA
jgi:hypothetical protein